MKEEAVGERRKMSKRKQVMKKKPPTNTVTSVTEHCQNPFKSECKRTDIAVSIPYKGEQRLICRECWADLAEKEWNK